MSRQFLNILLSSLLIFLTNTLTGQQLEHYSFSNHNWQLFNPAAINYLNIAGEAQYTFIDGSFRKQWLGLKEAPTSYNVRFEKLPNIGSLRYIEEAPIKYGLYVSKDQTDAISTTNIYGNFAYLIRLNNNNYLSLGINAGVFQYKLEADKINFKDLSDPSAANQSQWHADFSLGAFYVAKEKFYLGFSIPQTFNFKLNDRDAASGFFETERKQHLYFIGGGFIPLEITREGKSFIEPTILIRYVSLLKNEGLFNGLPFSTDLNLKLQINKFWGGVGFGASKNLHFELGTFVKDGRNGGGSDYLFKVGLAYNYPIGFNGVNLGQTAEIVLGFAFD